MTPIELDTVEVWPQKGRGGWYRNYHGSPIVAHPDGGKRTLRYYGASDLLTSWDEPYSGDPVHGHRGTFVHAICDLMDTDPDAPWPTSFIEHGEALGISHPLQARIAGNWLATRAALGIQTVHIEIPVVDDRWKVATNVDNIDRMPDGTWRAGDKKTATNVIKAGYLLQLVIPSRSVIYNQETGERTRFAHPVDPNVANIWWYPIGAAIAAEPDAWPVWSLIEVDLRPGHLLGNMLHALKTDDTHRAAFSAPIVAPIAAPTIPPVVERPAAAGGDDPADVAPAAAPLNPVDRYLAAMQLPDKPEPVVPDEGEQIDEAAFDAVRARYLALPAPQRAHYARIDEQAVIAGVPFRLTNDRTVRRFEIIRALCVLAECDSLGDDDTVRALLYPAHGDRIDVPGHTVGQLVGALHWHEAAGFAELADRLAAGALTIVYGDDGSIQLSEAA